MPKQVMLSDLAALFDQRDHTYFQNSEEPLAKQIRGLAYVVRDGGPPIVKTLLILALQQYHQRKQQS